MRRRYEPHRRTPHREHFEPAAVEGERKQDDRDAYGEYPGQSGDGYDDAERRFGPNNAGARFEPGRNDAGTQFEPGRNHPDRSFGPGRNSERQDAAHGFRGHGPRGYVRSDERVREEVCELLTDADVDVSDVEVNVSNGEVTLSGVVDRRVTKREIERIVDGVPGVKDVSNQLRIGSARVPRNEGDALDTLGGERKADDGENRMP